MTTMSLIETLQWRLTHGGVIGPQTTCPLPGGVGTSGGVSGVVVSEVASSNTSVGTSEGTRSGTSGSIDGATGEGTRSGPSGAAGEATRNETSGRIGGAASVDTSSGTSSTAVGSLGGVASGVPTFSPIAKFFKRLRKNYQGAKTEKLKSLQEFERSTGESLREAYTRMRRLISVTHGVTEA